MFSGISAAAKWAIIAAIALPLIGGAYAFKVQYDNGIINAIAAKEAKAMADAQMAGAQRTIAGLLTEAANAETRAKALGNLKGSINAVASSRACVSGGAYRALVAGVRGAAGDRSPGATPATARASVAVQGPATTAH